MNVQDMNYVELRQALGHATDEINRLSNEHDQITRSLNEAIRERKQILDMYNQYYAMVKYYEVLIKLQNLEERTRLRETYAEREHKMYLRGWIYELRKRLIIN